MLTFLVEKGALTVIHALYFCMILPRNRKMVIPLYCHLKFVLEIKEKKSFSLCIMKIFLGVLTMKGDNIIQPIELHGMEKFLISSR